MNWNEIIDLENVLIAFGLVMAGIGGSLIAPAWTLVVLGVCLVILGIMAGF